MRRGIRHWLWRFELALLIAIGLLPGELGGGSGTRDDSHVVFSRRQSG